MTSNHTLNIGIIKVTLISVMTDVLDGVSQEFLTTNTYQLSDEGKTLTVGEFHKSKLNGEETIKKVYIKKHN